MERLCSVRDESRLESLCAEVVQEKSHKKQLEGESLALKQSEVSLELFPDILLLFLLDHFFSLFGKRVSLKNITSWRLANHRIFQFCFNHFICSFLTFPQLVYYELITHSL